MELESIVCSYWEEIPCFSLVLVCIVHSLNFSVQNNPKVCCSYKEKTERWFQKLQFCDEMQQTFFNVDLIQNKIFYLGFVYLEKFI